MESDAPWIYHDMTFSVAIVSAGGGLHTHMSLSRGRMCRDKITWQEGLDRCHPQV